MTGIRNYCICSILHIFASILYVLYIYILYVLYICTLATVDVNLLKPSKPFLRIEKDCVIFRQPRNS